MVEWIRVCWANDFIWVDDSKLEHSTDYQYEERDLNAKTVIFRYSKTGALVLKKIKSKIVWRKVENWWSCRLIYKFRVE
jgi:hypothetical protein